MIASHLPALQVVVPLIAAPACVLLRGKNWAFTLALLATWVAFAASCALLASVLDGGVIGPKLVEHGFDFIEPAQLYPMGFHAEHAIISQSRGQNPVIPAIDGGKILFDQGDDFGLFHVNSPAITAYYGTEI